MMTPNRVIVRKDTYIETDGRTDGQTYGPADLISQHFGSYGKQTEDSSSSISSIEV